VNNVKIENEQGKKPEAAALLDCGQASKVTKGVPFFVVWEMSPPPWDTTLF
jgi:hypothetical protein